jgi:N-acetylglutamate synthase-like GNAT family acetyltransferase
MNNNQISFRNATNQDCDAVKALVFNVLAEYGLVPEPSGTDSDLNNLETNYFSKGGIFEVLVDETGEILGTVGLFPIDEKTIELRKMYFKPELRGKGLGKLTLKRMISKAKELGFSEIYLETASVLKEAVSLYESFGFKPTCEGMHTERCDRAYVLGLSTTDF